MVFIQEHEKSIPAELIKPNKKFFVKMPIETQF